MYNDDDRHDKYLNEGLIAERESGHDGNTDGGECIKKGRHRVKKSYYRTSSRANLIFYCVMAAFPLLQFAVFYIGVNFNSLLLAFRKYDALNGIYTWVGFANLKNALNDFLHSYVLKTAMKNSITAYFASLILGLPISLFFSYYIYKKFFLHSFYKIVLFLPSILSAVAISLIFYYFAEQAIPQYADRLFKVKMKGLLSNPETAFITLILFSNFMVSTSVLMYTGAMGAISESVVEAAQLDGITPFKEFLQITLPSIYPTFVTFQVVGIATVFTNQLNIYTLMGSSAEIDLYTLGYYLFRETNHGGLTKYPYLSSMGVLMTMVAFPATMLLKYALEKFGPKTD